jgi:pimeloyl-ACP methyl ester carboxylesterase
VATGRPARWLYILHGIYGAGRNWASLARRITRARSDWGAVLVDLRQHGASQDFPPPHTIVTAAEDVVRLARDTGDEAGAMLGHSFGGKVALAAARRSLPALRQVWVVDSTPDAREPGGSAWAMLEILRSLPERFDTRDELIDALVGRGQTRATAQWMATNLVPDDGGYRWRFDFDALETLLRDFFRTDLWPVVERPPDDVMIHFVKAEESSVLSPEAVARIEAAAARAPVHLHLVEGGHWLNADNPDALVELLVHGLPACESGTQAG